MTWARLPELGGKLSAAALGSLRQRGIDVPLGTADDARQTAAAILARDQGGWPA